MLCSSVLLLLLTTVLASEELADVPFIVIDQKMKVDNWNIFQQHYLVNNQILPDGVDFIVV